MCGIFGFIGTATHPKANYALLGNLAIKTEHRGKEATGIWGTQGGNNGQIIYHKEPITASKFIETDIWKALRKFDPNLLLVHCREPSMGVGIPSINKNNHPHVNDDYTVGLIHNGRVEEYYKYRDQFKSQIKSQCDSELLLRVFETGERVPSDDLLRRYPQLDQENFYRIYGIEQIFKKFEKTHMAVAVGERHEGTKRSLWLFRNEKRPLQVIDLRASMGVIYFCSTMGIWREAVEATPEVKNIIPLNHDVVDFPVHYAYSLSHDPEAADEVYVKGENIDPNRIGKPKEGGWNGGWRIRKYKLLLSREEGIEEEEIIAPPETTSLRNMIVYTGLNENDEVQPTASLISTVIAENDTENSKELLLQLASDETELEKHPDMGDCSTHVDQGRVSTHEPNDTDKQVTNPKSTTEPESNAEERFDLTLLSSLSSEIVDLVNTISVNAHNDAVQSSIFPSTFKKLLDDLEQVKADLTGIKFISSNDN